MGEAIHKNDNVRKVSMRPVLWSVNLNRYDLKEITTLEYGGKVLKPVKTSRIGGHHSSGTIVFRMEKDITNFTIRIKGLPGVEKRVYSWKTG